MQTKYILNNLGAYFHKQKILAISDLHIGIEESYSSKGQMIPKFQFEEIEKQLTKLIKETKPDKVIICGDLKHEFGTISDTEWRETLKVIDLIAKYSKVILVRGNHDTILGPIANKRNIEIANFYIEDDLLFIHGDKLPEEIINESTNAESLDKNNHSRKVPINFASTGVGGRGAGRREKNKQDSALILKQIKTIIIGHEHPAITLEHAGRKEKYKCFLHGKYKKKELLVLPSFNQLTEGMNILENQIISPLIDNLKDFEVFIVGDEALSFGKVKDVKKKFG